MSYPKCHNYFWTNSVYVTLKEDFYNFGHASVGNG